MVSTQEISSDDIKTELFQMARKGEWDEVVGTYESKTLAHKAIITKSGDTALHIAVSDGQEEKVKQLVDILISNGEEGKQALKMKNEQGNTPLHVAASMGSVGMCECIAQVDPSLVGARNEDSETPFFLAALHGKKEAFLCLLGICGRDAGYDYSRKKNDGETILHCAIAGDHFGEHYLFIYL
jgi:ankyrin repeat protein